MNRLLLIVCAALLGMIAGPALLRAQAPDAPARISGRIADAETGQLLEGTHIYLSGTMMGTAAAPDGRYRLQGIPAGAYRLVVSHVGYERIIEEQIIGPGEQLTLDFSLQPAVYELPELYVGDLDEGWQKDLKRFNRHFIGASPWADSVRILNPEVLRFDRNWWGRFTAQALAPLQIENRALGYRITYLLREFSHANDRTRWDGEPLFTEMRPADAAQAAYWRSNRRKAFYGSMRHFLLALLNDRLREEGFVLYQIPSGVYGYSGPDRDRTGGQRFIGAGPQPYIHHLSFNGLLKIVYTRELEGPDYTNWLRGHRRTPGHAQTSWLELNERPVIVDADGEMLQPYGATQSGYFAFTRLAEATPRQYRPADWK